MLLPSSDRPIGSSNDNPGTPEMMSASPDTTVVPVPTVSNLEILSAPAQETEIQEPPSGVATLVPTGPNVVPSSPPARVTRSHESSMQTVSTQTDSNIESQHSIITSTPAITTATTGLYGTFPGRGSPNRPHILEKTKKSVATHYLRTADIRDLPSYPTAGLSRPEAAGAAAALLAHRFHKPVEIWRPDPFSAAGAAASIAHANPKRVKIWKATSEGLAGKAALHALVDPSFPQLYQVLEASKRWSLNGAIGAMQGSKVRRRSGSSPAPLNIQQEAEVARAGNSALTAATIAHMPMKEKLVDAGRVPQQDKRKSDIPRAATISMFESSRDTTLPPDTHKHKTLVQPDIRRPATAPPSRRYNNSNIEEAARKVAAERLAKIGYNTDIPRSASLMGAQGARASIDCAHTVASPDSRDLSRVYKTNADMTLTKDNLIRADAKKRGENAILLMSTAQRNVQVRMSGIDKQVAESRGLLRREDWDAKATEIAQAGSDKRMKHRSKVSIGGGAYMTPGEIDAIAEKNVLPVLDEINRNAEAEKARTDAERARVLEVQMEVEEFKRVQNLQRTRDKEIRADIKRAKAVEREEEKRRKEEQKRAIKERKQLVKIESKRGRESMGADSMVNLRSPTSPTSPKSDSSEGGIRGLINRFRKRHSRQISQDEKNAITNGAPTKGSPIVPTFSGGHLAAMAEHQQQQQHVAETSGDATVANGGTSPRLLASRIPRRVSAVMAPLIDGTTITPGSVRTAVITSSPSPVTSGNGTEVRRRHSLPSVGSTGYRFKGRKFVDDTASSNGDQGAKKGKSKVNGKITRDFSKANGRILSMGDHSEYPDEARDTFSQQPTVLNRPISGYFPQDKRRFSAGETISSRFRENL